MFPSKTTDSGTPHFDRPACSIIHNIHKRKSACCSPVTEHHRLADDTNALTSLLPACMTIDMAGNALGMSE